jgi:hypothetical protein
VIDCVRGTEGPRKTARLVVGGRDVGWGFEGCREACSRFLVAWATLAGGHASRTSQPLGAVAQSC